MKKATYVNALGEAPECFEAAAEPTIATQDKQEPRTKVCELCGMELPLDSFSWHKSGRRKKICKECQSRRIKAGNDRSDKVQRKRSEIMSKADAPQERRNNMKARHKDTGEIIELAEEGIISCDGRSFCWYQVELIPEPIDDFKPSLPSNIDEAAEEYGRKEYSHAIHFWDEGLSKNKPEVMKEDFVDAFKAGAEWQELKMMEGAVEGEIIKDIHNLLHVKSDVLPMPSEYKFGDKVKIIILKGDKQNGKVY